MLDKQITLYLGPQGKMKQELAGFTFRQEQLKIAQGIGNAFTEETFVVAEAGTGVGKTFAYLIPAVLWASQRGEKVVVSTRTKALQQQIMEHDLPDLAKIMDGPIKYAEARGRENYLCWNKYMTILAGKKRLSEPEQDFIQAVLYWAESTRTGDRQELALSGEKMKFWPVLAADRNNCLKDKCRYHDKCFRLKMIRNLDKADIIVVNHALLLSDTLVDNTILPTYENLIIDEAHTFIKESFDSLSFRFGLNETHHYLGILHEKIKKGSRGYLIHLKSQYTHLSALITEASQFTDRAAALSEEFFRKLGQTAVYGDQYSYQHVITLRDQEKNAFTEAVDTYVDWQYNINLLLERLRSIEAKLDGAEEPEIAAIINSLQEISDAAYLIMEENLTRDDAICWIEFERGKAAAVCSSPIYTGNTLGEKLYDRLKTLVMVSATMTVDNSFENFISRCGLKTYQQQGRLSTLLESSPFDFDQQAALYVVKDMPDPGSDLINLEMAEVLKELLVSVGGRTMVLFTARKQMEEVAEILRPYLMENNLQLLVQNQDGEFGALMEGFTGDERSILMGLETFWEGIDLKGDLLKCLVIVKLPFRSPSDPYCTAWDKYYQLQKKSGFQYFMLPDAAIRLKQGVGRLIRSEQDRGAVVILDPRLLNKKYGQILCNSLPIKKMAAVPARDLPEHIKVWL
ncbi:Helicase, C-terminal [Syntrophomonas zehnderi OL-4]|uniref:DNA 5'-3' helicase n=1 Tax=Syntrophomonas zehnderi OL-4 TaxID=690567 RepID=A0A0E4G8U1_9FIRM|nr:helicase C-terminal domain-containing protein [Syntrophomonas zehnderi]CFW97518.1 Helicase, C-terminal [Syntrophomonas zehnderi OL-4]